LDFAFDYVAEIVLTQHTTIDGQAVFSELGSLTLETDILAEYSSSEHEPIIEDVLEKAVAHLAASIAAGCLPALYDLKIFGCEDRDDESYAMSMTGQTQLIAAELYTEDQRRYQKAFSDATSVSAAAEKANLKGERCRGGWSDSVVGWYST
jgi:hypothetical protein